MLNLLAESTASARGTSDQSSQTKTSTVGQQDGTSGSETNTVQSGRSHSEATQETASTAAANGVSDGTATSKRWVHISHAQREVQETGQLKAGPSTEQLQQYQQLIMGLPARTAVVNVLANDPVVIRSADMPSAFESAAAASKSIDWLKQQMLDRRDYIVVPNLDPRQEDERIRRFLTQTPVDRHAIVRNGDEPDDESPLSI